MATAQEEEYLGWGEEEAEDEGKLPFDEDFLSVKDAKPKKKKKKKQDISSLIHPVPIVPKFTPYFWDTGKLGRHTMDHLPEEHERFNLNIKRMKRNMWEDAFSPLMNPRIMSKCYPHRPKFPGPSSSDRFVFLKTFESLHGFSPSTSNMKPLLTNIPATKRRASLHGSEISRKQIESSTNKTADTKPELAGLTSFSKHEEARDYISSSSIQELFIIMLSELLTHRPESPIDRLIEFVQLINQSKVFGKMVAEETGIKSSGLGEVEVTSILRAMDETRPNTKTNIPPVKPAPPTPKLDEDKLCTGQVYFYKHFTGDLLPPEKEKVDIEGKSEESDRNLIYYDGSTHNLNIDRDGQYPLLVLYYSGRNRAHDQIVRFLKEYAEAYVFLDAVLADIDKEDNGILQKLTRKLKERECGISNQSDTFYMNVKQCNLSKYPILKWYIKEVLVDEFHVRSISKSEKKVETLVKHGKRNVFTKTTQSTVHKITTCEQMKEFLQNHTSMCAVLYYTHEHASGKRAKDMMNSFTEKYKFLLDVALVNARNVTQTQSGKTNVELKKKIDDKRQELRSKKRRFPVLQIHRDGEIAEFDVENLEEAQKTVHLLMEKEENMIMRRRNALQSIGDFMF